MHSINALELPEIAKIIASYLGNLEPCLTVCKTWRSLYLPYYWFEAEAGIHTPERKDCIPILDPTRHSHYIKFVRTLTVYTDLSSINQGLNYPNLRVLRLHYPQEKVWDRPCDEDPVLKDFVSRHLLLECLELRDTPPSVMNSAWKALVDHPRLETVIVKCNNCLPDDFWKVCARLRTLMFRYNDRSARIFIPKDLMLPSIRHLKLATFSIRSVKDELDIIAACPLLEDLVWYGAYTYNDPVWLEFGRLMTRGTWPHLQQLSLKSFAQDADLSRVIASMHQATKIDLYSGSIGPLSFAALQRHANTLRFLRIPKSTNSRIIQDVLCIFQRLEHLDAPRLDAKDIVEGGPWVCTSLRKMLVTISFTNEEDHLQPIVYDRMSRLVYLEEFDNRFYYNSRVNPGHGLRFRLQSGMAVLASLSRLRHVGLDTSIQAMDFDDVQWIIDHWKRLETIRGRLCRDISLRQKLEALLSTNGIENY